MHQGVQHLFQQRASEHPTRVALESVHEELTYQELDLRSNRLALLLSEKGVRLGDRVAILSESTIEIVTGMLATLKTGAQFVLLDPSWPEARLATILDQISARALLLGSGLRLASEAIEAAAPEQLILLTELDTKSEGDSSAFSAVAMSGDAPAYVYFTSGSTGRPKGIVGRLRGIDHFIRWQIATFGVGLGTRVSQLTHPTFDAFLRDVFTPLCAGGTVVIPESRELVTDSPRLVQWLDRQRIQVMHGVPTLFRTLLAQPLHSELFLDLKTLFLSGEVLHPRDVLAWQKIFGERIQLINLYGPSETTMTKFFHRVTAEDAKRPSVSIGRPMPGAAALLVDRQLKPVAPGAVGEILLRTPFRSHGYLDQPELTAQAFIQNPFGQQADDLVYRTGDQARQLADGTFEFLGRRDQQIKVRGVRVEIGEVETLLRQSTRIHDAAVIARQDPEGNTFLAAFVVPDSTAEPLNGKALELTAELDLSDLRSELAGRMSAALLPSILLPIDALPRTASGKVDRRALLERPLKASAGQKMAEPARSSTEEILLDLFREVLGIESLDRDQSLFELGGHSLTATRLAARIQSVFEVDLSLQAVIASPSVAALALEIESQFRSGKAGRAPAVIGERPSELPSSPLQQVQALQAEQPPLFLALRLTGRLDVDALADALRFVGERHEVLRVRFADSAARTVLLGESPWQRLEVTDLADTKERETELHKRIEAELLKAFDLRNGPLTHCRLWRLEEKEHALLLVFHRSVVDGWSLQILLEECLTAYHQRSNGQAISLPPVAFQYLDYAIWQRQRLAEPIPDESLERWRRLLRKPEALVWPNSGANSRLAISVSGPLDAELVRDLREVSRRARTTLFTTLVSAFAGLTQGLTQASELLVLAPVAKRDHPLTAGMVGPALDHLPLLWSPENTSPENTWTFDQWLEAGRRSTLDAWRAQSVPFEAMLQRLVPDWMDRPFAQLRCNFQASPDTGVLDAVSIGDAQEIETLKIQTLKIQTLSLPKRPAVADLQLQVNEGSSGVTVRFEVRDGLLDDGELADLPQRFNRLLQHGIQNPQQPIDFGEAS